MILFKTVSYYVGDLFETARRLWCYIPSASMVIFMNIHLFNIINLRFILFTLTALRYCTARLDARNILYRYCLFVRLKIYSNGNNKGT